MQFIQVRTTQNVFINYPLASIGDRILAYVIDKIIQGVIALALFMLLNSIKLDTIWVWIAFIALPFLLYSVLFEIIMNGQTPGKRVMNIKVIKLNGTPASIGAYILRWVFSLIDFGILSGAIAVIIIAAGGKGQRLGDIVAGTSVIKLIEQKEISANELFVTAEENYQVNFPEAIQLTEQDISLIQRALEVNREMNNPTPMMTILEKIKERLGIQTDLPPVKFLYTLLKDYNHLSSK